MKKILIVHNKYLETGGEDVSVLNEIEILKKYFTVETIFFNNSFKFNLNNLKAFLTLKNLHSQKKLEEKISDFNPDLVYVHNIWFKASLSVLDLLDTQKIKYIIKLHNFRYFCTRNFLAKNHSSDLVCKACGFRKKLKFFNKYYKNSYLKSFLVIRFGKKYINKIRKSNLLVLTKFHKDFLINLGFSKENIHISNNFMNIEMYDQLFNRVSPSLKNIIFAGRISEEKGVLELIESFKKSKLSEYTLEIIGTGPMLKKLSLKNKTHNIKFTGHIDNKLVLEKVSTSTAVVAPSKLFEGQPTVLCEASFLGKPSIYFDNGGIGEFYPNDYPLSCNQRNISDLVDKLNSILDLSFSEKWGVRNKKFIEEKLNEDFLINNFKNIIDSI